jgi:ABC-type transporter Mla subunit MlaD
MLSYLKQSWILFGIKAPWFSWLASFLLLAWPAYELIRLFLIYRRQSQKLNSAVDHIGSLRQEHPTNIREGLHGSAIENIRDYFQKVPLLMAAWNSFESNLIYRKIRDGESERIWVSESAESAFHEDAVLEYSFNKRFFLAIPGIVTGTGLLFTFIAILFALFDVKYSESTKTVEGLDTLISGLSGKFISSVAALFSATIFLMVEKSIFHRLDTRRRRLITAIDSLIPRLAPLQLLVEIQRDTSGQSDAFRMFSADLAMKLKNSFDQSMGPIMERMVTAIGELNQFTRSAKDEMISALNQMNDLLREAEHNKQDNIADQLQSLLNKIESTIVDSLSRMTREFNSSISGSTMTQFQGVADTLGATTILLEKMNSQFEKSQEAMGALIVLTKDNFEKQIATGQSQIENLAGVLNKLSEDMKKTIEDTSLKSSEFATGVISEVSSLSAENADRLRILLEKHESELNRVEELDTLLQSTLSSFDNSIKSYGQVTNDLKQISSDVKGTVTMMTGVSNVMKEGQEAIRQVASLAQSQIKSLTDENLKQRDTWHKIQSNMSEYEQIFKRVENNSKSMITEVLRGLEAYNTTVHKGFDNILSTANDTLGNAVERLSGSIDELQSFLDELSDEITKFNSTGRGQQR